MKEYKETEIETLAKILKQDGVICVPTDTVYGICARINSPKSFNKLMKIKKRSFKKSFPVMCATIEQIKELAIVDEKTEKIIQAFMPGPITLVLKKNGKKRVTNNAGLRMTDEIAIRLAPTKVLKELIELTGSPIFMTSANPSNFPPCNTIEEVKNTLPTLDGYLSGEISWKASSTVLVCKEEPFYIQRPGPITMEQILKILEENKTE